MGESMEKVIALTNIPRGARTRSFLLQDISDSSQASGTLLIQVGIWTNGEIKPLNALPYPTFWPKQVKIAPDCHVQNVRLSKCTSSEVFLQAIKDIRQGEELLVWFGEDLLNDDMGIPPYLSPSNIQGGKSYVCQECGKEFEAPNPLKIHIALSCNTFPYEILWTRLSKSYKKSPSPSNINHLNPKYTFPIKSQPIVPVLMPPLHLGLFPRPNIPATSAFQPISTPNNNVATKQSGASTTQEHQLSNQLNRNGNGKTICLPSDPHAQLESIVSNMGKARNGHVCLYCGKLYSRKYGLKIHIRTHTGYKPLLCRICHRPFGDPSNLNKHIRLHSDGNTPYRCEVCGKVLVRKRDLERHIRSRHTNTMSEGVVLDCTLNSRDNTTTPSSTSSQNGP